MASVELFTETLIAALRHQVEYTDSQYVAPSIECPLAPYKAFCGKPCCKTTFSR